MRTILRAFMLGISMLSFHSFIFSQQVAKSIPYATPEGIIGFLQFTPPDYGSQKHPLIIFLHGIGERGNGTTQINSVTANAIPRYCAVNGTTMRFTVNGQTSSFVVLSPQLSTQYGSWPPFYVTELIKYAKTNLQIDPNRIYVTGLSLGGGGVWRAITDAPNGDYSFDGTIAAAAPVCGTQEETDANVCATIAANRLPVWAFHSMDDGTVGVGCTQHAEILMSWCTGINPSGKFTYYQNGGHAGAWVNAYDTGHITVPTIVNGVLTNFTASPNMYEWFLSNTRGATTQPTYTSPVTSSGNAQTITLPTSSVTLTGTGNGTNGATISSYVWKKTSGPASGSITNSTAASTTATGLTQGIYVFTLTVTDNHGLTSSSAVSVTVNAQSTEQPIGYIRMSSGSYQACSDGSVSGRIAVYGTSIANGTLLYLDGGHSQLFNGGWNWYSFAPTASGAVTMAFTVYPNGSVNQLYYCSGGVPVTTSQVAVAQSAATSLLGYIKMSNGSYQACSDGSTSGRIAIYGTSIANGSILYTDVAMTQIYNGGWNWYSFAPTASAAVTSAFTVYPNGSVSLLSYCSGGVPVTTQPTQPVTASLIGYIKTSTGPYQACADPSSSGRIAVYGTSFANGSTLYTDAAMTQIYNGGWNWYSFTQTLGAPVTAAFAIYPNGGILLLRSCDNGGARMAGPATTVEQDETTLKNMKDSAANAGLAITRKSKLMVYPNPVSSSATIELYSASVSVKNVSLYDSKGVLKAKYTWQTVAGTNIFSLKNVDGLSAGLYVIEISDSKGKHEGSLKFLKIK